MKYIITQEQLQGIINYLASRPYGEVVEGIEMLRKLPVMEKEEKKSWEFWVPMTTKWI